MENFFKKLLGSLGIGGGIALIIMFVLFLFVIGPLFLIWGINLIGFDVPYNFYTLFGAFLIMLILRGNSGSSE